MNTDVRLPAPFDSVAHEYDTVFTHTPLGQRKRAIVRRYVKNLLRGDERVLELNCGTGEDAVWLAERSRSVIATDISENMLAFAAAKAHNAGMDDRIRFQRLDLMAPGDFAAHRLEPFHLVISNFDGLNCVQDVSHLPRRLFELLTPGGDLVLVYMNPVCMMEIGGLFVRGRWSRMLQRLRRKGLAVHIGQGMTMHTWFHPVRRVRSHFAPWFETIHIQAVGLVTPPTSMRGFFDRRERWFRALFGLEDLLAPIPPFNRIGDHVLLHFKRRHVPHNRTA